MSASNQVAQDFFGARALLGIFRVGNGAGLVSKLQLEESVF
jgi:hypothetical protein